MKSWRRFIDNLTISRSTSPFVPVERALGGEVLQASGLARYHWPDVDPESVEQGTRRLTAADHAAIRRAATALRCDPRGLLERSSRLPLDERILHLLSHGAVNFNSALGVRSEAVWRTRISNAIKRDQPVRIVYPLFCKIGNWAKQMTATGATAGEEAILCFFKHLHELIQQVYAPGIVFEILADAHLYNTALQNTPAEAAHYLADVMRLADRLGVADVIRIHDYASLLADESRQFRDYYNEYYYTLLRQPHRVIALETRKALYRSLLASVNTRRLRLTYDEHRSIFGPRPNRRLASYLLVQGMVRLAFVDQLAIKMAADRLNLPERLWPDGIRVSCHKGLKHGRHVIGLRVFPSYYRSTRLLPYHGMTLLTRDSRGRPKLDVLPEIVLRGRTDLTRLVNEHGEAYAYVAPPLPPGDSVAMPAAPELPTRCVLELARKAA